MLRLVFFFRFLLLSLIWVAPFVFLGGVFFHLKGAWVGGLCAGWVAFIFPWFCEKRTAIAYGAYSQSPQGLVQSLTQVAIQVAPKYSPVQLPRLLVFPTPVRRAFVAKSFGSSGTIFLSQGLIASLPEEELRRVFAQGLVAMRQPGVIFKSICSILALWVIKWIPLAWMDFMYGHSRRTPRSPALSPLTVFQFLIPFQGIRVLQVLAVTRAKGIQISGCKDSQDFVDGNFGNRVFP